jgi:hypothetical protein
MRLYMKTAFNANIHQVYDVTEFMPGMPNCFKGQ